jgi:uncharacterized protein YcbK (DUF882 family)
VQNRSVRKVGFVVRLLRARKGCGLAALILLISCNGLQTATADGDTRTLSLHHIHTDENISITYKRNGRYDEDALKKLNWFLRDWRREEATTMDPQLFDLIWEVSHEVRAQNPIEVVCGYRSPQTNAMLRRRGGGVARFSQHMLGKAMDFFIPGAALEDLRVAGLRLQRGGVGYYPTSGSPFVHLDTGNVRHWPRMTREELARVFPDGRTVHIPSDGRPLDGYALALADLEKRRAGATSVAFDAGASTQDPQKHNLLASLFGASKDKDEEEDGENDAAAVASNSAPSKPAPSHVAAPRVASAAAVNAAPANAAPAKAKVGVFELASVPTLAPTFISDQQVAGSSGDASASDVIASRGNWATAEATPDLRKAPVKTAMIAPAVPAPVAPRARTETKVAASSNPWNEVPSVAAESRDDPAASTDALAYAAQQDTQTKPPAVRAAPMGSAAARANSPNVLLPRTVSVPEPVTLPAPVLPQPKAPVMVTAKVGDVFDDPWLRALVVAPDLRYYMTVTSFDAPDFRQLRPMMEKPVVSIKMTFSADPQAGLATDHFSGNAVVFLSTLNFVARTASLQ